MIWAKQVRQDSSRREKFRVWGLHAAAAAAKSLQSCPTLCNPIDGSPPGSRVPGILQARTLERVAISFSNAWKWKEKLLSRVRLLATPWTAAHQAFAYMSLSFINFPSTFKCWIPSGYKTLGLPEKDTIPDFNLLLEVGRADLINL